LLFVGAQNCAYSFIQGGESLSVAVYWGYKLCVTSLKERRIIVSRLIWA